MQKILFVHQTKHVGGGQSFVDGYKEILQAKKIPFDFFENLIDWKMIKNIFQKKYQQAFLHIYSPRYLPLVLLLKIFGASITLTVYGVWFLELQSQVPTQFRKRVLWLRITQAMVFIGCDTLIVFSDYEKDLIEQYFPFVKAKIKVIPGGVDLQRFHPVSPTVKKRIRTKLHLPLQTSIFLVLSRLDRRKGADLALEAFSQTLRSHQNSLLCVVFPTDDCSQLEILTELLQQTATLKIGQKVHFITGISQNEAAHYFQACDVFIMSSVDLETFGLTTLEAAASGCLPIGFKSGATPEILQKVDKKLIVSPINSKALAQRLLWALRLSGIQKRQLLTRCRLRAKDFAWQNISRTLGEILA